MGCALRVCYRHSCGAVVGPCETLAEIIRLHFSLLSTEELPIDFVEIIREENHTAYDPCAWRGLDNKFNSTEENLEIRPHSRGIMTLGKGELRTFLRKGDFGARCDGPIWG